MNIKKGKTVNVITAALFTALMAVFAQIPPSTHEFPITLQTFGIALCGYILGIKYSFFSIIAYILLGAVGAPVFSGFCGGVHHITGPAGGFIKQYSKMHKKVSNAYGKDMYSLIKKHGNTSLKNAYNDFVLYYKDNNSKTNYFKWDSKAYGVTVYDILPTIKLSKSSYVYNGKAQKPTVTVTNYDGRKLTGSSYYKVSYPDGRKNVGEYKVKITIKGSLGSTVYKTFTIKPKSTKITGLTAKNDAFKIKWSKKTTQSTGYQIRYSLKSSFSSYEDVLIKKDTTTSKTINNLKSKKNYYVKIRTYKTVDGKKIYSAWSSTKKVKTK